MIEMNELSRICRKRVRSYGGIAKISAVHKRALDAARVISQTPTAPVTPAVQGETQSKNVSFTIDRQAAIQANNASTAATAPTGSEANNSSVPAATHTPPTSSEDDSLNPAKRQKKDRNYSWLQKSDNLALLEAQGKINSPEEQQKVEREEALHVPGIR